MTGPLRALASLIVGLTTAVGMVVYQHYSREPPSNAFTVAVTMGASILAWLVTALEWIAPPRILLWGLKPVEAPLSEISDVTIDTAIDRASGVEVCHTMLIMHGGKASAFPAADKTEAETNAATMRHFLAITA